MSIIIRLQNLPWSANSIDIRRYFTGLSIPEGGVHIVGGEMGDAFIAFSTDEDARLAMAKDGGKIKDMQIKLLLSSRTEMMRVIEQARQQNLAPQPVLAPPQPSLMSVPPPTRIPPPVMDSNDRRRERSPSPRRSRDRSPARDRHRSPDNRRSSKRERSRSPRNIHSSSRDTDRRNDRFKRDDRRYGESSRYRNDNRSMRERSPEQKKYLDADHVNSRSQLHATEGFRTAPNPAYDAVPQVSSSYSYSAEHPSAVSKSYPSDVFSMSGNSQSHSDRLKQNITNVPDQRNSPVLHASHQQYDESPFDKLPSVSKCDPQAPNIGRRRRTRFEPEFGQNPEEPQFFQSPSMNQNPTELRDSVYNGKQLASQEYHSESRTSWPRTNEDSLENAAWSGKRSGLLHSSSSKNEDFVQEVPMDLDPISDVPSIIESEPFVPPDERSQFRGRPPFSRNSPVSRNELSNSYSRNNASSRGDGPDIYPRNTTNDRSEGQPPFSRSSAPPRSEGQPPFSRSSAPPRSEGQPPFSRPSAPPRKEPVQMDNSLRGPRTEVQVRGSPSLTVEIKGLPSETVVEDILEFFRGIPIPPANVRLLSNLQGTEKALIRFNAVAHVKEAFNRNSRFPGGRYEMDMCPDTVFDTVLPKTMQLQQRPRPKPKPREEDLCIQMRGLPFQCKEGDIVLFFDGLHILDLFISVSADGRASGSGFVEFGTPEDFRAALAMNGKMIGHRYITISVASKDMMAAARGDDYEELPPQQNSAPVGPPSSKQARPPLSRPCVAMRNLPETVTNTDITDFFGEVDVMPRAIHIMLRPDKKPSGDAFAELASTRDLEAVLRRDDPIILGNPVALSSISYQEVSDILGRPNSMPPTPVPGALLRTPNDMDRTRRPLLPHDGGFRERPRMEPPMRNMRPRMEPMRRMEGPNRPPFGRMRGPWPRPFARGPGPESRFAPPSSGAIKDFGSPGCVVSINNLHFRAGLEELLEFFQGYTISKDSVIRKYNENGQTTGEARVAFQNPREAQQAVRELNQKPIMGRPLALSIL